MVVVGDVVYYIRNTEGMDCVWLGNKEQLEKSLVRINTDQGSSIGDMAWISQEQYSIRPDSVYDFKGSLLIAPKERYLRDFPILSCSNPKLAFTLAVNHFFHILTETTWPLPRICVGSGVIMEDDVFIAPGTVIANTYIKRNVTIGANCSIGLAGFGYEKDAEGKYHRFPHIGKVIIEEDVEIGSNTCIDRGSIGNTVIGKGTKIDNLVHIAHNAVIGKNCLIIANSMIGGSAVIGDNAWIAPSASIMNQIHIEDSAFIGMGTVVLYDVGSHDVVVGNPAKVLRKNV